MGKFTRLCFGDHAEHTSVGELNDLAKEGVFITEICTDCEMYQICKDFSGINKNIQ